MSLFLPPSLLPLVHPFHALIHPAACTPMVFCSRGIKLNLGIVMLKRVLRYCDPICMYISVCMYVLYMYTIYVYCILQCTLYSYTPLFRSDKRKTLRPVETLWIFLNKFPTKFITKVRRKLIREYPSLLRRLIARLLFVCFSFQRHVYTCDCYIRTYVRIHGIIKSMAMSYRR